jgi:hypothetical protein
MGANCNDHAGFWFAVLITALIIIIILGILTCLRII